MGIGLSKGWDWALGSLEFHGVDKMDKNAEGRGFI